MSRGTRPVVAIGEAKQNAIKGGFLVIDPVTTIALPFDFIAERDGAASRVRVRRLREAGFRTEQIARTCRQQIRELRECTILRELTPDLWVRGPGRLFHRYRIHPDRVEELEVLTKTTAAEPVVAAKDPGIPWWDTKPWTAESIVVVEPYVKESPAKRDRIRTLLKSVRENAMEEEKTQDNPGENPAEKENS